MGKQKDLKIKIDSRIFAIYALLMSKYYILEGRKAKEILPTNNPLSDLCVTGFTIPVAVLMTKAFGAKGELREKADKVLAELCKE